MASESPIDRIKQKAKKKDEQQSRAAILLQMSDDFVNSLQLGALVASDDTTEHVALYVLSQENVLTPVTDKTLEASMFEIHPALVDKDRKELLKFIKLRVYTSKAIDMSTVKPVAFADELDVLTWNRLPFKRAELGLVTLEQLPAFTHFLSLCDDPDGLALWIGSLLDPHSGRTQYLHLHGGGGNGKSTLFNAITDVLGERYVVKTRADEFANQHWGSIVEGKRLLIFPDENNPGFFSSGKFKEFTGEESTTVNPKYEKPRTIILTHKTVIFSNNQVEISKSVADRRRLLSISMKDDPDGNIGFRWWYDGLRKSGAEILAYCYHEYERAKLADPSILAFIPQREEAINDAIDRKYGNIFDAIAEGFIITGNEDDTVRRLHLRSKIREILKERGSKILDQQIVEALSTLGVSEGKVHGGAAVYRGIKEIGAFTPNMKVIK